MSKNAGRPQGFGVRVSASGKAEATIISGLKVTPAFVERRKWISPVVAPGRESSQAT
jgi:hypothetical protein